MVWFALAFMAAAAVLCVSWPLLRPKRDGFAGASDVAFYRQQLIELDADVDRGVLRPADVESTRAELGRRLIGAAERTPGAPSAPDGAAHRIVAGAAAAAVLLVAGSLYAKIGHPAEPDAPLAARLSGKGDFNTAMARIEAHLASDPNDARGFSIMAPIYLKVGRFDDAVRAYRAVIRILGPNAERRSALGQAMVMAADGVVTADAREAFDAALAEDPQLPQARFFEGLADLQDGQKVKARDIWTTLVREAPPEAPYTDVIRRRIADLDGVPLQPRAATPPTLGAAPALAGPGAAPGTPAGAAALAALPAGQQQMAIRGMVDGLAARLEKDGQDSEGWLRLVRAYRVLGEDEKARKALSDARRSMTGDPKVLGRLEELAHELGLES